MDGQTHTRKAPNMETSLNSWVNFLSTKNGLNVLHFINFDFIISRLPESPYVTVCLSTKNYHSFELANSCHPNTSMLSKIEYGNKFN